MGENRDNIFSFCGFDESESERFFLSVIISEDDVEIDKLVSEDDGLWWIQKIYMSELKTDSIKEYEPGYYNGVFPIRVLKDDVYRDVEIRVEVIVNNEF